MSKDIPITAHDHGSHRVFSVDDDPNEVESDVRYLEGLHDGMKYALNAKSSSGIVPQVDADADGIDNSQRTGGGVSASTITPGTNVQSGDNSDYPSRSDMSLSQASMPAIQGRSTDSPAGSRPKLATSVSMGRTSSSRAAGLDTVSSHPHVHALGDDQDKFIIHGPPTASGNDLLIEELSPSYDQSDRQSHASSLESFTLKERQDAINKTHPFGIRIWKPALYKKQRSVQRAADEDIHETKFKTITLGVHITNILWSLTFGLLFWVLFAAASAVVGTLGLFTKSARDYAKVMFKLANYLLWPFGKVVYLNPDEHYLAEDRDEGISVQQFYKWVTSYSNKLFFHETHSMENQALTGSSGSHGVAGASNSGNTALNYPSYGSIQSYITNQNKSDGPAGSDSSVLHTETLQSSSPRDGSVDPDDSEALNFNQRRYFGRGKWTVGRVLFYLLFHLVLEPVALLVCLITWLCVFTIPMSSILWNLLYHCRKHPLALGFKYIKTSNSQNRPMIMKSNNHLPTVRTLRNELHSHLAAPTQSPQGADPADDYDNRNILLCTFRCAGWHYYKYTVDGTNIIVVNLISLVFFTIFDFFVMKETWNVSLWFTSESWIFILCLASIIPLAFYIGQAVASISAQTSMGVGAVINAFFSTVVEVFLYCVALKGNKGQLVEGSMIGSILGAVLLLPGLSMCGGALNRKTQRYNPASAGVSSALLIFSMIVMFVPTMLYEIYGSYTIICRDESNNVVEDVMSLRTVTAALTSSQCYFKRPPLRYNKMFKHVIQPMSVSCAVVLFLAYAIGLWFTLRTHAKMIWQLPISDPPKDPRSDDTMPLTSTQSNIKARAAEEEQEQGGHEAPNWSRSKSTWILLVATLLYATIAEILVACVDSVLEDFPGLDPKFLGLTIFALVPNTTEFLNAISFAMHGNVALSMEIGSAYALQVCLLQIPALVVYSIMYTWNMDQSLINIREQMFPLVFPRWDLIGSMASVFMFTYLYAEGKSNYFKGSMLILMYVVIVFGFWFQGVIEDFRT
ncbi:Vnx1 protein [Maudiozyma humilis]|uniref:Vnx1 protein n=1 Tax=Maudiozyma humilis TaxID=51915 RepID=A0AAV5S0W0_MAUHU|nr:Vnx1 protein [Kazachstania humilis]